MLFECCYKCTTLRHSECHSSCKDYREAKAVADKRKADKTAALKRESIMANYISDRIQLQKA